MRRFSLSVLLTLCLVYSGGMASAEPQKPTFDRFNACQWLLLNSHPHAHGKSPFEIPWVEFYQELRLAIDPKEHSQQLFPYHVPSKKTIERNFGRLTEPQRKNLVKNLLQTKYSDYLNSLEQFYSALTQIDERLKNDSNLSIQESSKLLKRALYLEEVAVLKEQKFIAYLEQASELLGSLFKPYLDNYTVVHLRPDYGPHVWHLTPQLAERMLTMSIQKHSQWDFSEHALEQSELRGFSEDVIVKGLKNGRFKIIEARPKDDTSGFDSLRFKVHVKNFIHEGREKHLTLIVKFTQNDRQPETYKTTIITAWNENMKERFRKGLEWLAATHKISLKNKKYKSRFKAQSHNLLHELTFFTITHKRAELLITKMSQNLGRANAKHVLKFTAEFIEREMPKAQTPKIIKIAYQDLYNETL